MTKLLIGITAHGLGHLAQTGPVVTALRRLNPSLEITVLSAIAPSLIETRIPPPVQICATQDDFGLVMASPFEVDAAGSFRRYSELHERRDEVVAELADWLREEYFDGVLANISYLLAAAARDAGIPALAMSSLNWCDLFRFYCEGFEGAKQIAGAIRQDYLAASCMARLEPAMAMPDFETRTIDEAIAETGTKRRDELCRRYDVNSSGKIILFALGGANAAVPPGWNEDCIRSHLIFGPTAWAGHGPWRDPSETAMSFTDLLASADAVVTRPGYGTVTEVAAAGVPAILLSRDDWPEEPGLVDWLTRHGRCIYFDGPLEECRPQAILSLCEQLAAMPEPPRPEAGGAEQAAMLMEGLLRGRA